jgi:hypothetical protein
MRRLLGTTLLCLAPLCAGAADAPYVHRNRTIETLEAGHPVFGLFSGDFSLTNVRALARSDLDFVTIGYWNDAGISPAPAEALAAGRQAAGRE